MIPINSSSHPPGSIFRRVEYPYRMNLHTTFTVSRRNKNTVGKHFFPPSKLTQKKLIFLNQLTIQARGFSIVRSFFLSYTFVNFRLAIGKTTAVFFEIFLNQGQTIDAFGTRFARYLTPCN